MRTIGFITVVSAVVAAVAIAGVAIKTVPDINHYRRIRKM